MARQIDGLDRFTITLTEWDHYCDMQTRLYRLLEKAHLVIQKQEKKIQELETKMGNGGSYTKITAPIKK